MLCCNLMTIRVNWMCQASTQGIRNIKTFTKYKNCYCWWIYHHKKSARSRVECWGHCDKIKTVKSNVPSINYSYFAKSFNLFCCKIEIVKKIKCWVTLCFWVWLNITLVLRFMKSNKFYYVQTAKVVDSKNGSY